MVGLEACRGLDFAHRKGLVHTELTPSKLVFGDDRRLRIVDFGLARILGESDWKEPSRVATHVARYASPEQAEGKPLDGHTDVYSLALILVEAVTGNVPFDGESTVATLSARIGKLMPVSADLGPLAAVLERAGRPEAAERFSASQFGRALVRAADKLPRPTPIPILAPSIFEDRRRCGRRTIRPGGIARPPATPERALVTPSATPVSPTDETDEIAARRRRSATSPCRRRPLRAATARQRPTSPPTCRSGRSGCGRTRRRPGARPTRRRLRMRRRGAGHGRGSGLEPSGEFRRVDRDAEPAGSQEGSQGPAEGGQGQRQAGRQGRQEHGSGQRGGARRRPFLPSAAVAPSSTAAATEASPMGAMARRAVPARRARRARLPRLGAVPHADARGPGSRRPAARRGARPRRRLRLGDHRRRRPLRRVPHPRSGDPDVPVGGRGPRRRVAAARRRLRRVRSSAAFPISAGSRLADAQAEIETPRARRRRAD